MLSIGEPIKFGRRAGTVIGHTILTRVNDDEPAAFYIVELDTKSMDYLVPFSKQAPDCFVSMLLIHVGNEDDDA